MVDQKIGIFLYRSQTIKKQQLIMLPGAYSGILIPMIVEEKVGDVVLGKHTYN